MSTTKLQQVNFGNIASIQYQSNVYYLYFSNLPVKRTSATGFNFTFKVPLSNSMINSDTGINSYFYNEQSNFKQELLFNDSHFIFNNLVVSLYNKYGSIASGTPINYSFTIEIEYE